MTIEEQKALDRTTANELVADAVDSLKRAAMLYRYAAAEPDAIVVAQSITDLSRLESVTGRPRLV